MIPPERPTTTRFPALVRDDFDPEKEPTQPDPEQAVTNAALLKVLLGLGNKVETLSHAVGGLRRLVAWCAAGAGALLLFGLLLWWTR